MKSHHTNRYDENHGMDNLRNAATDPLRMWVVVYLAIVVECVVLYGLYLNIK